jgi:hypothetical protein
VLNLPTTSSLLQVVTGSAVSAIQVHASWVDLGIPTTTVTPGATDTIITTATTATIVAAPAANTDRNVKFLSIQNTSATTCQVTVQYSDGTNVINLFNIPLIAGYTIQYNSDGSGFVVYDASGNILTAKVPVPAIAAGTQTATAGTVLFSNSNDVSFGMSASSIVTASANSLAVAAGTQTATSGTVVFSNSNNVSFGLSQSSVLTAVAPITISAGTTSNTFSSIVFSNSNNLSFGLSGSTITAQHAAAAIAAGTQTATSGTVVFSNSNDVSFGMSNSSVITASANSLAVAAGTQTATSGTVVFSNSNDVSFGMSNSSVITASANSLAVAAGTQTATSGTVVFSNSNNVSFGLSQSSVLTAVAPITISAGTTSNTFSSIVFSNSNNLSFGLSGSTITAQHAAVALAAGTQTATSGTVILSNSNGFTFGMSNSSVVTAVYGGMSSWSNGGPGATFTGSQAFLSLNPVVVPYALTATAAVLLAALSNTLSLSTGGLSLSLGIYSVNGGTALSLASSATTQLSFASSSGLSAFSGTNYRSFTLSWAMTPGLWVMGAWQSTNGLVSASWTFFSPVASIASIVSGTGPFNFTNQIMPGISVSSIAALPASIAVSNTSGYVRTGSNVWAQPWLLLQGT